MKLENIIQILNDVSEKFNNYERSNKTDLYYNVLHISLSSIVGEMTKEQYLTMPKPYRTTIEEMESLILINCSRVYKEQWNEHIQTNGRFRKDNQDNKSNIITKTKQEIGFKVDEGTTI